MSALHGGCSDFSDDFSGDAEVEYMPAPAPVQKPRQSKTGADAEPVTTGVFKTLLADLQKNILTDVTALRGDLQGLAGRVSTLEGSTQANQQNIATLQKAVHDLQQLNRMYEHRFAAQEDARRRHNLKVRRVPEEVLEAELPHVLRCMFTAILPPGQAISPADFFRVPKPTRAPATRDTIVTFCNGKDNAAVLTALHGKTPLRFENMALTFFDNLSSGILVWHRLL
ncbi:Hypothetical predicted protein [Pelobates cultripes]|uniref:Uncharacterized protein n=1 Tax=Pelobates cultripes TaxID=61616 RepID=A0AAD1RBR5_PELCU|nr:Hypothetical predicted protein [Pelobates cultripes]